VGAIVLVIVIVLLLGYAVVRRVVSMTIGHLSVKVLNTLEKAPKPLNVSEIAEATGQLGGAIIPALKFLHKRGWISSTQPMRNREAAMDSGRYSISPEGRRVLRESYRGN
jgi:DNA-binding PadR family transcriptional regulator